MLPRHDTKAVLSTSVSLLLLYSEEEDGALNAATTSSRACLFLSLRLWFVVTEVGLADDAV
jgi:hypothetical protein